MDGTRWPWVKQLFLSRIFSLKWNRIYQNSGGSCEQTYILVRVTVAVLTSSLMGVASASLPSWHIFLSVPLLCLPFRCRCYIGLLLLIWIFLSPRGFSWFLSYLGPLRKSLHRTTLMFLLLLSLFVILSMCLLTCPPRWMTSSLQKTVLVLFIIVCLVPCTVGGINVLSKYCSINIYWPPLM